MKVVVASTNPVKINAVQAAFTACQPAATVTTLGIKADSGVRDQPASDEETRRGARNRVTDARRREPAADFWVGLEGGIEIIDDALQAFAWIVVSDDAGRLGMARSATLPLPPSIRKLIESGMELGDANDQVFASVNSKQQGGAFGLLTDGRHTRESIYSQTVTLALIPVLHPLFREQ